MKTILFLVAVSAVSPIEKTVQLLTELQAKIVKDGESSQKIYDEFTDFCQGTSKDTQFEIKTSKGSAERSTAAIAKSAATIASSSSKIEELAASIATSEKDLAAATEIREGEAADFAKLDADLAQTVSMLERAVSIIEKEMSKSGSFVQTDAMANIQQALQTVIDAASVNIADKAKVQALLQTEDEDLAPGGAPDPAAYKSKSGGIVSTLEDMLEKSKAERAEAQKAEMNAAFDFKMLKQKLEDSGAAQNKEMNGHKKQKSAAEEAKAGAEGELETANAETAASKKKLKDLQQECMDRSSEYEQEQHERSEELAALGKAKSILEEKTGGASARAYSFVQLEMSVRSHTQAKSSQDRVVALFQRVAKEQGAQEFSMLATRVQATALAGGDPFAKVKGLIQEMIEKLVAEAEKEAGQKAFCDKEMAETAAKKEDKSGELDDVNTKIDKADAKIAKLTEDITTLTAELVEINKVQLEADKVRAEEKGAWGAAKADFEAGVEGVGMALQVLRDYYAEKDESFLQATKETGAASGIIGLLEVIESDFTKMLAEGNAAEEESQKAYETLTKDNEVDTAAKTTERKFKAGAIKETEAALAGLKGDRETAQTELDAILEYWDKLQPMCVAKPEPYAERKRRREAEIAGLKEGLRILNEESGSAAFLQIRRA